MKKISLKGLELDAYEERLENGLMIYMLPYANKKNYFISYATYYGSDVIEFSPNSRETIKPPLGIAHFLEHKMFEQESGIDPFTFFSESGTDSNASTSFESTQYICYGTKNFSENLRFLLHFVNKPFFTDENVEKEKGIIAEEIKMYEDMPDFKLEMSLRESLYKNHPRRIDIAGSVEEISKITKEDLLSCYNNFYGPNNMFVLIVGNFDKEEALRVIEEELGEVMKRPLPKVAKCKEPTKVKEKECTIQANVEIPKIAVGLKVPVSDCNLKDYELDLYLEMLTTILFGPSSEFRERVRESKILNMIYTDWESIEDFRTFYIMASTINPEKLLSEIKKELTEHKIKEKDFNRIKKVWIAKETRMIDNIEDTVNNVYDDLMKYHTIIPNKIDKIKTMKLKKLQDLIENIDFTNISTVKMIQKKKEEM